MALAYAVSLDAFNTMKRVLPAAKSEPVTVTTVSEGEAVNDDESEKPSILDGIRTLFRGGKALATRKTRIIFVPCLLTSKRMTEKLKTKTITIKETTWIRLKNTGVLGDTFDSVINRALDCYESITVR